MSIKVSRQVRRTRDRIEDLKPGDLFQFADPAEDHLDFEEIHMVIFSENSNIAANLTTGRTTFVPAATSVYAVTAILEWKYRDEA